MSDKPKKPRKLAVPILLTAEEKKEVEDFGARFFRGHAAAAVVRMIVLLAVRKDSGFIQGLLKIWKDAELESAKAKKANNLKRYQKCNLIAAVAESIYSQEMVPREGRSLLLNATEFMEEHLGLDVQKTLYANRDAP